MSTFASIHKVVWPHCYEILRFKPKILIVHNNDCLFLQIDSIVSFSKLFLKSLLPGDFSSDCPSCRTSCSNAVFALFRKLSACFWFLLSGGRRFPFPPPSWRRWSDIFESYFSISLESPSITAVPGQRRGRENYLQLISLILVRCVYFLFAALFFFFFPWTGILVVANQVVDLGHPKMMTSYDGEDAKLSLWGNKVRPITWNRN